MVEVTAVTWWRLTYMDDWLNHHTKSAVHVFFGKEPDDLTIGSYNVPTAVSMLAQAEPILVGPNTKLRFVFDAGLEALIFKISWC